MNKRISGIFDNYGGEPPEIAQNSPINAERVASMTMERVGGRARRKRSILRSALIAAAVMALLAAAAFAKAPAVIGSQKEAVAAANLELNELRRLGVITADFTVEYGKCTAGLQNDGHLFSIFSRSFDPFYLIYFSDGDYYGNLSVSTVSGKITQFTISAKAAPGSAPWKTVDAADGTAMNLYDNFGDIFDPSITVDDFCGRLRDYWGYSGYKLISANCGNTPDDTDFPADGAALLSDRGGRQTLRTTVSFTGDQAGQKQYIEVSCYSDGACLMAGFAHSLG